VKTISDETVYNSGYREKEKMSKFEIGQTLRRIDPEGGAEWLEVGATIKVAATNKYGVWFARANYPSQNFLNDERFELVEKTMQDLQKGDVLLDNDGNKVTVLGRLEDLVFVSNGGLPTITGGWYLVDELPGEGYTLPEDEVKEMTVAEVEKLVGSKVKIVKE
jgi:hypothetical protein